VASTLVRQLSLDDGEKIHRKPAAVQKLERL
jgi:hypothetical protein